MAVSQSLVSYKIKKLKKKSGPKSIIGKANAIMLKRFISKENQNGFKVTSTAILSATKLDISRRTINNWLKNHEYKYKKEAQKLQLTARDRKLRVEMISSWIHKNISWEDVVFTEKNYFRWPR